MLPGKIVGRFRAQPVLMGRAFFPYPMVSSDVHSRLCVLNLPQKFIFGCAIAEAFSKYSTPLLIPQMSLVDPAWEPHPPFDFHSLSNQAGSPNCLSRIPRAFLSHPLGT